MKSLFQSASVLHDKNVICNFEGLVATGEYLNSMEPILFNEPSSVSVLKEANVKVAALANNHVLDLPAHYVGTIDLLRENDILYCGIGRTRTEANKFVSFDDKGTQVIIINGCWDFLLYAHKNPTTNIHVATIDFIKYVKRVKEIKADFPYAKILVYLHWSFDLEILPFPLYRQWSKELIDHGADFVIGCHSHCVQGGEKYNNGYIVYGLGNFYIPNNYFANGRLKFPSFASQQLCFEFDFIRNEAWCHWFDVDGNDQVVYSTSNIFEECHVLKSYSSYEGMDEKTYLKYYKKFRRKKKFIPIYKNYKSEILNALSTHWLKFRAKFARALAKRKIIKWQS